MRRLNLGCGSIQPDGWMNVDRDDFGQRVHYDILVGPWPTHLFGQFDLVVVDHLLSCFSHGELTDIVLPRLCDVVAPGGILRVLVPDAAAAAAAYLEGHPEWFPQGDDMPDLAERFCTYLPWFGESKSIFTNQYLEALLRRSGFTATRRASPAGVWGLEPFIPGTAEIDQRDRYHMALIMEARK